MIRSLEKRFKNYKTPHQIEWLTDKGSIYRDKSVQNIVISLGLKTCYTAQCNSSSNGILDLFFIQLLLL